MTTIIAFSSGSEEIIPTLHSLSSCIQPACYKKTIVIENGGPPGCQDVVNAFRDTLNLEYIHVREKGKTKALNVALDRVDEGLIYFTDSDIRFTSDTLRAYSKAARSHGPGHFFGGPFNVAREKAPPTWLEDYLPPSAKGWKCQRDEGVEPSFSEFLGFNWAAFASDIKRAGGFDESIGPGSITDSTGDETDMQRRLVRHGASAIYVSNARVTHIVPRENCTPEWALNRSMRNGVVGGIHYTQSYEYDKKYPPLWIVKAIARKFLSALISLPFRKTYYHHKYWLLYHIGFLRGIMQSRRLE
jgi:glycosyltransferase involved in cell wall biosynthesis